MNTIKRQITVCIVLALLIFSVVSVSIFFVFPLDNWSLIWSEKIIDLPVVVFVPALSAAIAMITGIIIGSNSKKQLQHVEEVLAQVEQGRPLEEKELEQHPDLLSIWKRTIKIQKHIAEQTKLTQKLANEKAESREQQIQEIVSQERNRLARELHDSVSQQLFAASMLMSAINETRQSANDLETKQLKMVESMIAQSQLEMRALLLHLRPVALKDKTLQEGIEELLIELTQKVPLEIHWKTEPIQVEKGIEDHLFRILQESVSNTLRHSKAESLEVLLIERDGFFILRVVDDGVGFNVEETKAGSYGLQNMYERAIEIGGTLKIVSIINKGTRLEVKVPKLEKEDGGNEVD